MLLLPFEILTLVLSPSAAVGQRPHLLERVL